MNDTLTKTADNPTSSVDLDFTVSPMSEITVRAAEFGAMLKASVISRSADSTLPTLGCTALQFDRLNERIESDRIRVAATDRYTLLIAELSSVFPRIGTPPVARAGLRSLWVHNEPVVLLAAEETDDIIRFLSKAKLTIEVSVFSGRSDGTSSPSIPGRIRIKIVGTPKAIEVPTFHGGEFPSVAKLVQIEFAEESPSKFGINSKFLARIPKVETLLGHVESVKSKSLKVSGDATTVVLQQSNKKMTIVSPLPQPSLETIQGTLIDWNFAVMHIRLPY